MDHINAATPRKIMVSANTPFSLDRNIVLEGDAMFHQEMDPTIYLQNEGSYLINYRTTADTDNICRGIAQTVLTVDGTCYLGSQASARVFSATAIELCGTCIVRIPSDRVAALCLINAGEQRICCFDTSITIVKIS